MIDERNDDGSEAKDSVPARPAAPPIDRASESIVNPIDPGAGRRAPPPKQTDAIESGEFDLSPASFSPSSGPTSSPATSSPPASLDPPPSTIIANALGRGKQKLSIGAIVGIFCAIFVVLVGLTLLLFR
jgi:hypothetical protein